SALRGIETGKALRRFSTHGLSGAGLLVVLLNDFMTLPTPEGGGFYHTLALADPAGSGATLTGTDVSHPVVARLRMWMAALWSRARLRPQPSQKVLYNMNLYNAPERERLISPCLKAGALRRYPVRTAVG